MAVTQALCTSFKQDILNGVHAFGTTVARADTSADTYKIALYTSDANLGASTTVYTTDNEVVGTGYVAGGETLVAVAPATSGTTAYLDFNDVTWTTATITAYGALIYNADQGNKAVAVISFGENKTSVGENFTIIFPAANATTAIIRIS